MTEQNYYRVSVKGIVIDDEGRILLTREEDGRWEMLGGGLDHGEDPATCLQREILEETGLQVTHISEAPLYFLTVPRQRGKGYIANVIYEIKLKDLNFIPSDECQELRFFHPAEMHDVDLFANVRALLALLEQK